MPRLALHLVWGCYGFWLPNDPRGSWSRYVGSRSIYNAGGAATTVSGTRSYAKDAHDRDRRLAAKKEMKRSPVRLTGAQAQAVALGVTDAAAGARYILHALCVMPDHVHVVLLNPGTDAKQIIQRLKSGGTRRVNTDVPDAALDTVWARGGWFVPLESRVAIERAIQYVERNPPEAGLRRQRWSGVVALEPSPRLG